LALQSRGEEDTHLQGAREEPYGMETGRTQPRDGKEGPEKPPDPSPSHLASVGSEKSPETSMKILLIKPPANRRSLTPTLGEPLELEYLASAAEDHQVSILDMRIEKNLQGKLEAFRPDIVGITAYTCEANMAREVLKEVKKHDARINTVVGGHHATFLPHDFNRPYIDAVFLGFADNTFPRYIGFLDAGRDLEGVPRIALVQNGRLVFTEKEESVLDLDSLPFPARHLTRQYRKYYRDAMRNRTALVLTNRGCPFRCTFCACWKLMNGKYSVRSPESVMEEMARLPEEVNLVCFADDNTLHSTGRARRFIELLKKRKNKRRFTMYARAETIVRHPDLIEGLKETGLEYLTVGIESFRDDELDRLHKQSSVALNEEAIRILQRLGVGISAHFIVDPGYDKHDFEQLYRYICRMNLFRPAFAVLTPLPGTELYSRTKHRFVIRNTDYFDFAHSILSTKLERKDFYREYARLYRKSYSIQRYIRARLTHFRRLPKKSRPGPVSHLEGLSLAKSILVNIVTFPLYLRLKNSYKSEPPVQSLSQT